MYSSVLSSTVAASAASTVFGNTSCQKTSARALSEVHMFLSAFVRAWERRICNGLPAGTLASVRHSREVLVTLDIFRKTRPTVFVANTVMTQSCMGSPRCSSTSRCFVHGLKVQRYFGSNLTPPGWQVCCLEGIDRREM